MKTYRHKGLLAIILILAVSLIGQAHVQAQEEPGGFMDEFDGPTLEGWEHSQDISLDNGVLRLDPGNFIARPESYSGITATIQMRFQPPNEVVVNYYMQEGRHYALILIGDRVVLEKISAGTPSGLGEGPVENFNPEDWNEVVIQEENGTHTITINQVQVLTVTDPEPLTSGGIMVHALGGAVVELDAFSLTGVPTGEAAPGPQPPAGEEPPPGEEPAPQEPGQQPGPGADTPPIAAGSTDTQSILEEFLAGQSNQLELSTFLINLVLAAVTSFILGRVYIFWGTSLSNRRAFAANFMLLTVTTTFVILVVRSSVALSLGLVGALSIVRFRAAVKEPEELAYLFFAISLGIGLGDNQRLITLLTLVVAMGIIGLVRLFRHTKADVNLHLTVSSQSPNKVDLDQITETLEKHCSKIKLLRFDETPEVLESSYVIEFKRLSDLSKAKADLQALAPSMQISFMDNKGIW